MWPSYAQGVQRFPAAKNSFWILDVAVVVFKVFAVLTVIGTVATVIDTATDDAISSDWRTELAVAQFFGGLVTATVLGAIGAVIDVWLSRYERD